MEMNAQPNIMEQPVAAEGNVFRRTNAHKGRRIIVTPANSTMQHLCYARTILDRQTPTVQFENGNQETALICLSGEVKVSTAGQEFTVKQYDAAYISRDSSIKLTTDSSADIAEFSSDVNEKYPLQIVRYEDVKKDNTLHFMAGGSSTTRNLNILIGKNVQAGRVVAGFTIYEPGHWTSWTPHEHAAMLEEIYVLKTIQQTGFCLQYIFTHNEK